LRWFRITTAAIALWMVLVSACAKQDAGESAKKLKAAASKPAPVKPPPPPEPTFSDKAQKVAKLAADGARACVDKYIAKIDLEAYAKGDLAVDLAAMHQTCGGVTDDLLKSLNLWILIDRRLDRALFEVSRYRDTYKRVELYLKRVGAKKKRTRKRNAKKLERFAGETKDAARALATAAADLRGVDLEAPGNILAARRAFLETLPDKFERYLEAPVRDRTAMYHGVGRYLAGGATRLRAFASQGSGSLAREVEALEKELDAARAFFKDFELAADSKKKLSPVIKELTNKVLAALGS
jgi:hypothetical protein